MIAVLEVDQAKVVLLGRSFNRKRTSHKINISLPARWQTKNGEGVKCLLSATMWRNLMGSMEIIEEEGREER